MKATPTETDREAARLFELAQGMRVRVEEQPGVEAWATVCDDCTVFLEWTRYSGAEANVRTLGQVMAIDIDGPATVGCMLAQVEAMRPGHAVSIVDRLHSLPGERERRFAVLAEHDGTQTVATGPTRGAALVAAMKALLGAT